MLKQVFLLSAAYLRLSAGLQVAIFNGQQNCEFGNPVAIGQAWQNVCGGQISSVYGSIQNGMVSNAGFTVQCPFGITASPQWAKFTFFAPVPGPGPTCNGSVLYSGIAFKFCTPIANGMYAQILSSYDAQCNLNMSSPLYAQSWGPGGCSSPSSTPLQALIVYPNGQCSQFIGSPDPVARITPVNATSVTIFSTLSGLNPTCAQGLDPMMYPSVNYTGVSTRGGCYSLSGNFFGFFDINITIVPLQNTSYYPPLSGSSGAATMAVSVATLVFALLASMLMVY